MSVRTWRNDKGAEPVYITMNLHTWGNEKGAGPTYKVCLLSQADPLFNEIRTC